MKTKGKVMRRVTRGLVAILLLVCIMMATTFTAMAASELKKPRNVRVNIWEREVTWSRVSHADRYVVRLYEKEDGEPYPDEEEYLQEEETRNTRMGFNKFESQLYDGGRFFFRVKAIDRDGNYEESEFSNRTDKFTYRDKDYEDNESDHTYKWVKVENEYYYSRDGEYLVNQWAEIQAGDGKYYWYHFDATGKRDTDKWIPFGNTMAYVDWRGRMQMKSPDQCPTPSAPGGGPGIITGPNGGPGVSTAPGGGPGIIIGPNGGPGVSNTNNNVGSWYEIYVDGRRLGWACNLINGQRALNGTWVNDGKGTAYISSGDIAIENGSTVIDHIRYHFDGDCYLYKAEYE